MGTLTITPDFATSITSLNNDGNSSDQAIFTGYESAVAAAINYFDSSYQTLGTANVSLTIQFGWGTIPGTTVTIPPASGAVSSTPSTVLTYAQFLGVVSTAYNTTVNANATAAQVAAVSLLPPTDPANNGQPGSYLMTQAQYTLLGGNVPGVSFGPDAGAIALSVDDYNWNQTNIQPAQSDAVGILEHEISEVLGRSDYGGAVDSFNTDPNFGQQQYSLMDFFTYTAAGNAANAKVGAPVGIRNLPFVAGYSTANQDYISLNGQTVTLPLRDPNDDPGNDLGDWGTSDTATVTSVINGTTVTGVNSFNGEGPSGVLDLISPTDTQVVSVVSGLVPTSCYAAGTRIATPRGPVAVEALAPGDFVLTASGGMAPVKWIGHRDVDCVRHPRPRDVWPVRVSRGAFGPEVPCRDLVLSPDHAVFVQGVLIPIRHLLNGTTIRQEDVAAVTYWHVELPVHDLLLAEGLAAESFLDTGGRASFINGGRVVRRHPDFSLRLWEAEGCAKLVAAGPELDAARARLNARAADLAMGNGLAQVG